MARIGCQTGEMLGNIGVDRPAVGQYNLNHVSNITPEVKELQGFSKKDFTVMAVKKGKIKEGAKIRIEAIFANGEAMVQKMGIGYLDSSSVLMKLNIERVHLNDLK